MFFEFEYFECSERIGACDTNSKELNLLYDQDRTCFLLSSLCIAVQFFAMFSVFLFLFLNIRIRLVPLLFLQFWCSIYRSSHSQLFFKIGVLENAATREKETPTVVFIWLLRHFLQQLFYRTPLMAASPVFHVSQLLEHITYLKWSFSAN